MKIQLRLTDELKNASIDILEVGNKATNAMKRNDCRTIGDVCAKFNKFHELRGIGKPTEIAIQNAVINLMIQHLPDNELVEWFKYLIENNEPEEIRNIIEGFDKVEEGAA